MFKLFKDKEFNLLKIFNLILMILDFIKKIKISFKYNV